MATLRRTGPAVAAPGTLVAPEDGTALGLASQVMAEAIASQDLESLIGHTAGDGAPAQDGTVVSLLYEDTSTMPTTLYLRAGITLAVDGTIQSVAYRALGEGTGGVPVDREAIIDAMGALIAMLPEFTYDPATDRFTFGLQNDSVSALKALAGNDEQRAAWAQKLAVLSTAEFNLERLKDLTFLPKVSPGFVDLSNIPRRFFVRADFRQELYQTATVLRMIFAGQTRTQAIVLNQSSNEVTGTFAIDDAPRAVLEAGAAGVEVSFVVSLLDEHGVTLVSKSIELEVVRSAAHPDSLTSIAQSFNEMIAQPTQEARIYSKPNYTETIVNRDDLDGDYALVLGVLSTLGYGDRGVDVDSLRVYVRAADRSTTEVHREDWTLVQDNRVIDFNISASEESGAGGRIQRDAQGRHSYHFIVVFYDDVTPVYTTVDPAVLWLEDETHVVRELPEYPEEGSRDNKIPKFNGDAIGWEDDAVGLTEADVARIIRDNIDTIRIRPSYWSTENDDARNYFIHLHSGAVPSGTTHLQLNIKGAVVRVEYVLADEDYVFAFNAAAAGNTNRAIARDGEETLQAQLTYQDRSGAQPLDLENHNFLLEVVAETPTDASSVADDLTVEIAARQAGDAALGARVTTLEGLPALPELPAAGSRDNKVPKFNGDVLGWEEDAQGTDAAIPDNSLLPIKAQADTPERQRAWRDRLAAGQISAGNTLPDLAETNTGRDVRVITQNVADGLSFVDLADPTTNLTSAIAGDVMMVLLLGTKRWVRVGNLLRRGGDSTDQTARDGAQEALAAAQSNSERLGVVEQKTADVDLAVDSSVWAAAPAQEVQITVIPESSTLHAQILDRSFDPADLTNAQVWASAVATTAVNDIVLMRLRDGLDNLRYRYTIDGAPEPIYEHNKLPNAAAPWTYFNLAQFAAGLDVVMQKRRDATHGIWKGELGGQALAPITEEATAREQGDETLNALISPFNQIDVTPHSLSGTVLPEQITVSLEDPNTKADSIAKVRVRLQGTILGTTAVASGNFGGISDANNVLSFNVPDLVRRNIANNAAPAVDVDVEFLTAADARVHNHRARIAKRVGSNSYPHALTSAAAITWNADSTLRATLALGVNAVLNITNGQPGDAAILTVTQAAGASRTLTLNAAIARGDLPQPRMPSHATEVRKVHLSFIKDGATWTYLGMLGEPRPGWRALAGASPYTVLPTDDEFRIEVNHTNAHVYSIDIARVQLVPGTAKEFNVEANRADQENISATTVQVTLNEAGTELTTTLMVAGGAAHWSIVAAYAR